HLADRVAMYVHAYTLYSAVRPFGCRIYIVHDEVKDKAFELELSWVGELTNGRHEIVPKDIREEAEKYAKESLKEEDESDDDNM
ncbi:PSMA3 isoform 11, partial [Pan troglodytes]